MSDQTESDNRVAIKTATDAAAKVNWGESLSETGQKQKRNMLAWAGIAIVLGLYNVPLTHVPWLCMDIPQARWGAAVAVVFVPLAYTFVGFFLYVLADLKRWRLQIDGNFLSFEQNTLFALNGNMHAVLSQLDDKIRPAHVTIEQSRDVVTRALEETKAACETLKTIRTKTKRVRALQGFIAYGWELVIPLLIGASALWLSAAPFLRTVAVFQV